MKRRNATPLSDHTPPVLHPLAATNLLSVFMDWFILNISYKQNHTLCCLASGFFHRASRPQRSSLLYQVPSPYLDCNQPDTCGSSRTQINMSGCARGKDWRGGRKDLQALASHTYSHFVELPRPFPQLPTDFQKGLFFYSLVENHSKHTSFPKEEKWESIRNYVRSFSVLYNNKATCECFASVASALKTFKRSFFLAFFIWSLVI